MKSAPETQLIEDRTPPSENDNIPDNSNAKIDID